MNQKRKRDAKKKLLLSFILAVFTTLVITSPVGKQALISFLSAVATVLETLHAGFVSIATNYGIWLLCVPALMFIYFCNFGQRKSVGQDIRMRIKLFDWIRFFGFLGVAFTTVFGFACFLAELILPLILP